jgi:hypothetical protein
MTNEFKRVSDLFGGHIEWELHGDGEMLCRAGFELRHAMKEYIVQRQMWDECDHEDFNSARAEILRNLDRAIEELREARRRYREDAHKECAERTESN